MCRMIRARSLRLAGTALITVSFALAAAAQDSVPPQRDLDNTEKLLGILPDVVMLQKISTSTKPEDKWRIAWLHEKITEKVLYAMLEFDAANAQIDREIAQADELHSFLSDRRDNTVTRSNLLGIIIGGGLSAVSSGLSLNSNLTKPTAITGLVGGVASAGFGLAGIKAQNGATSRFDFESNMLAKFFDRTSLPNSTYPTIVWTLLNQSPEGDAEGSTRKDQLVRLWLRVKRIDSLDSTEKIDHLTSRPSQGFRLTIDDLEDRAAMLHDVRARISYLKLDLAGILASLPEETPLEDGDALAAPPKVGP